MAARTKLLTRVVPVPAVVRLPIPALVVLDGEAQIDVPRRLWLTTPIQRCRWQVPRAAQAFYADDAANRHVSPRRARHMSDQFGELLREVIRAEHTTKKSILDLPNGSKRR